MMILRQVYKFHVRVFKFDVSYDFGKKNVFAANYGKMAQGFEVAYLDCLH